MVNLSDVHGFNPGSRQPLPSTPHLHGGADQAVQGEEDRRAAAPRLRYRGQLLHADEANHPEPVHCGERREWGRED